MQPTLDHFLVLSAVLLSAGIATVLIKRHAMGILMGIELMLNAAALNLVAFSVFLPRDGGGPRLDGQVFTLFVIVIAAAQAAVALAIFLNFHHYFGKVDVESGTELKG